MDASCCVLLTLTSMELSLHCVTQRSMTHRLLCHSGRTLPGAAGGQNHKMKILVLS